MVEKKVSALAEGLASAIKMQRERQGKPDRGFGSWRSSNDSAGMLFYLAGYLSGEDPEASELLQEMGGMVREELAAAKGVAA